MRWRGCVPCLPWLTIHRSLSKFEKKGLRPETEWVIAQGKHPPLVNADTFRKCGEALDRHQRVYGALTGGKPLLTGVLYCGTCGGKMMGRGRWKKAGHHNKPARYCCVTYRCYCFETFRDCSNGSYHGGKRLEEWVKGQLMRLPITPEDRTAAGAELRRLTSTQTGDVEPRRRALQEEKEARLADLKALSWRLVRDEIPAAVYAEMRRDVEAAIADIDSRLAQLHQAETLDARAEEALKVLDGVDWAMFDAQAWKEAIATLVSKVVVEGRGQYRIEWQPGVAELLS